MAKEEETDFGKPDIDDFDFNDGGDDPFGGGGEIKDDRSPATKVASGIKSGVISSAKTPTFYAGIMKKALPEGYGTAMDTAGDVMDQANSLFVDIKKELKPATKQLKRAVKYIKPAIKPILPKWVDEKLDKFSAEKPVDALQKVDPQEAQISNELASIFQAQAEQQQEAESQQVVRDAIETKRHNIQVSQSDAIRDGIAKLVSYQNKIGIAFQRKSLELQYRSYFAQKDTLELLKATGAEKLELLRNVVKNTGLPDFVKMRTTESLQEQFRSALIGKIQEDVSSFTRPFVRKITQNLRVAFKGKIQNFTEALSQSADNAEQANMALEMGRDMGLDEKVLLGELVGGGLAEKAGHWVGSKLRPHLEKNKKVVGLGHALTRWNNDLPQLLQEWAKSPTDSFGRKGDFINFIKQAIPQADKTAEMHQEDLTDLTKNAFWSGRNDKTLNEIIPGYLARLLQSSEGIRTGEVPDLLVYDWKGSGFTTRSKLAKKIAKDTLDKDDLENTEGRAGDMVERLAGGKLDENVSKKLKAQLVREALTGNNFDFKKFINAESYGKDFTRKEAKKLASAFRTALGVKGDATKIELDNVRGQRELGALTAIYKQMLPNGKDAFEKANFWSNMGHRDLVDQLGITDTVNGKRYFDRNYAASQYDRYLASGGDYEKTIEDVLGSSNVVRAANRDGRSIAGSVDPSNGPAPRSRADSGMGLKEAIEQQTERLATLFGSRRETASNAASQQEELGKWADKIVDAVSEASAKAESVRQVELLEQILDAVSNMQVVQGGEGNGEKKRGGILRRTGRGIGKGIGGLWKGAGWASNKVWRAATAPFRFIGRKLGLVKSKDKSTGDVYKEGEDEPVLTEAGFKAGEYFDAVTGKVIKKYEDIKGGVKDKAGNFLITSADWKQGLRDKYGRRFKVQKKLFMRKTRRALSWIKNAAFAPLNLGTKAVKSVHSALFGAPDVYVPGETTPRMLGKLIDAGQSYFTTKGKPIKAISDITTNVVDGDGKTVLTLEEFAKGVVNSRGKPIKTNAQKILGLITAPLKLGQKIGTWVLKSSKKAAKVTADLAKSGAKHAWGGAKAAGGFVKGLINGENSFRLPGSGGFGGSKKVIANQVENINVLKAIHNLLCDKFGVGGHLSPTPAGGNSGGGSSVSLKERLSRKWRRGKVGAKSAWRKRDATYEDAQAKLKVKKALLKSKGKELSAKARAELEAHGVDVDALEQKLYDGKKHAKGLKRLGRMRAKLISRRVSKRLEKEREAGAGFNKATMNRLIDSIKAIGKPKAAGDEDGDGKLSLREKVKARFGASRAGSWMETLRKRREQKGKGEKKEKVMFKDPEKQSTWGKLFGLLGMGFGLFKGLTSKIGGFFKKFAMAKAAGSLAGDIGSAADLLDGAGGRKGKKGLLRRAGSKIAKMFGRRGAASAATTAAEVAGNTAARSGVMGTVGRGLLTAGSWAARGALSVASVGLEGLAAFGSTVLGVLSSPVVLGAAAIAAVGYGAYKLYDYYANLKSKLFDLKMRQYGIGANEKTAFKKIAMLEDIMYKKIQWDGDKAKSVKFDKESFKTLKEIFEKEIPEFMESKDFIWFRDRFLPVYLTNCTALRAFDAKAKLNEVDDKVPDERKYEFAKATMDDRPNGPYTVEGMPFSWQFFDVDADDVKEALEAVKEEYGAGGKESKDKAAAKAAKNAKATAQKVKDDAKDPKKGTDKVAQTTPKVPPTPQVKTAPTPSMNVGGVNPGFAGKTDNVYNSLPVTMTDTSAGKIQLVGIAAKEVGLDPTKTVALGIHGNPDMSEDPKAFKMTQEDWDAIVKKYGKEYGIPKNATPRDPRANALVGALFMKDNQDYLSKALGRPATDEDLYLANAVGRQAAIAALKDNKFNAKLLSNSDSDSYLFSDSDKLTPREFSRRLKEVTAGALNGDSVNIGLANPNETARKEKKKAASKPVRTVNVAANKGDSYLDNYVDPRFADVADDDDDRKSTRTNRRFSDHIGGFGTRANLSNTSRQTQKTVPTTIEERTAQDEAERQERELRRKHRQEIHKNNRKQRAAQQEEYSRNMSGNMDSMETTMTESLVVQRTMSDHMSEATELLRLLLKVTAGDDLKEYTAPPPPPKPAPKPVVKTHRTSIA